MKHDLPLLPAGLAILACLFWAGNFVLARAVHADITPVQLAFGRWCIAVLCLTPFAWRRVARQWTQLRRHLPLLLVLAASGIAASNTLIYLGVRETSATNAVMMNAFVPVLVALGGWLAFGVQLVRRELTGLAMSLVGVALIVAHGNLAGLLALKIGHGDALVLAGIVCWAIYTLGLRLLPAGLDRLSVIWLAMLLGLIMLVPFALADAAAHGLPPLTVTTGLSLAYLGVFPSVLALLCYAYAVAQLGAARAAGFLHLIPAFGALLAMIVLGESLEPFHAAGISTILLGLLLGNGELSLPDWKRLRARLG